MKIFLAASFALALYFFLLVLYFLDVFEYFHMVQGYDLSLQISEHLFLGLVLVLTLGVLTGARIRRGGDIVLLFLFFMSVVPTIVLACLVPDDDVWFGLAAIILGFLLASLCYRLRIRLPMVKIPPLKQGGGVLFAVAIALCVGLYQSFGYIPDLVSFFDVYGRRAEFVDSLANAGAMQGYIMMWLQFLVLPMTFLYSVYYFRNGKYWTAATFGLVTVFVTILIYAYTALKVSVLMFAFLALILAYFKRDRSFFKTIFFIALSIIIFKVFSYLPGGDYVYYHTLRRLIVSPALDGYFYVQYFGSWPYMSIPRAEHAAMIAEVYYGTDGNANAGIFPSLYASHGYLGIFFGSIAIGFFLRLCDSLVRSTDRIFMIGVLGTYSYVLVNAHLFTSMFSYGLGFLPLLAWLLPLGVRQPLKNKNL